jgi:hypothetical protein
MFAARSSRLAAFSFQLQIGELGIAHHILGRRACPLGHRARGEPPANFMTLFDWQIGGVGASQNFGESVEVADMSGPD